MARGFGWRKAGAVLGLVCALAAPASAAYAQAATPTRPAVSGAPAAGEPVQDMMPMAAGLAALVIGGFVLKRFAARRA
jgi:hypothetical protein